MERFTESLPQLLKNQEGKQDHYFGISLREFIHEFKWQTLVLFKCALLQPKVRLSLSELARSVALYRMSYNHRFSSSAPIANDCA